jgi:hypothetical protein
MVSPSVTPITFPDHAAAVAGNKNRAGAKSHGNIFDLVSIFAIL